MKKFMFIFFLLLNSTAFAIGPRDAYKMVLENKAYIVDVREIEEIQNGMIDGAMWYPRSQMLVDKNLLAEFKKLTQKKKVFLYCKAGKRAEECKIFLRKQGIDAESIGGYDDLKKVLPTKSLTEQINRRNECEI